MRKNFNRLTDYKYLIYNQNGFKQAILDAYTDKGCSSCPWEEIKDEVDEEYNTLIKPQLKDQYPTYYPCIMIPQFFAWYEISKIIVNFVYKSDFEK